MKLTKLLGLDTNPKTVKGQSQGYCTAILYLAPYTLSGTNICPLAEKADCYVPCLNFAGRAAMAKGNQTSRARNGRRIPKNVIQRARLARTDLYLNDRETFMRQLVGELEKCLIKSEKLGLKLVVRLNGTSDIRWESIPCERHGETFPNVFAAFSDIQFYDYTKIPNRRVSHIPNYHLTFSYSAAKEFQPIVAKALAHYGQSVTFAAVFRGPMPDYFLGRRVINGDESDLRFLDESGVCVGLKAKGKARTSRDNFTVKIAA